MTDNSERICVLIPAYNMGKYLERCIDSVLSQTYRNIRVILINDGSTDNTKEICDEYERRDSRFSAIHTENRGHGCARNTGIENCKEKYVTMIDADDCVSTTFLESLYDVMMKSGADMVCPSYVTFLEDDEIDLSINAEVPDDDYTVYSRDEAMEKLCLRNTPYYVMPQKLYKTALFDNYRFPDKRVNVDEWAIHHLIVRSKKVAVSKRGIYFWRQSPEGMTRNFSPKKISGVQAMMDRVDVAAEYGYSQYIPLLERNLHNRAVVFYRKCRNRHINGKKLLKPYRKRLRKAFRFHAPEYKQLYDKKERALHWMFARNYLLFDILDAVIKDSTRY